tara:strand:- start:315 stop:737 length:423 start_codon:yes stop_codon:yes gene_type:complete
MKPDVQRIFTKLAKEKVDLNIANDIEKKSAKGTELLKGLKQTLKELNDADKKAISEIKESVKRINSARSNADKITNKVETLLLSIDDTITKARFQAISLGVDPNKVKGLKELKNIHDNIEVINSDVYGHQIPNLEALIKI